jgi:hypothetical protein
VDEGDEPIDLMAVRGEECYLVLCSNDSDLVLQFDRTNYNLLVGDKEQVGCKKLLFTLDDSITAEKSTVWHIKEFVRYAGEAALADVLDRPLRLSLEQQNEGRPGAGESELAVSEPGINIPHFPVRVTKEKAERISGITGAGTLKFMPYWVYHFRSSGEQVYKEHRVPFDSEGWGAINAINGIKLEIDTNAIEESAVPADAEIQSAHITKDEAQERIFSELVESLTQRVRIKQVTGDAISYEEKVLKPEKKNITIDLRQVHVPVWQIRGRKIIEVNAFTGETLSEPMDEGVEIL